MDYNQLKYFVETVETGSFSKASEKCFISQQAIGKSIKSLEDELGIILFDRSSGKKLEITESGKLFLTHALRIINEVNDFKDEIRNDNELQIIKLGSSLSSAYRAFAQAFYEEYSGYEIETRSFREEVLFDKLMSGEIDFSISSRKLISDALLSMQIGREHCYLAVPSSHRLANQNTVSIKDLDNEILIQFGMFNSSTITTIDELVQKEKVLLKVIREDDFIIYQKLRSNPKYLYVTTREAVNVLGNSKERVVIPLSDAELNNNVYLSFLKNNRKIAPFTSWLKQQSRDAEF